MSPEPMVVLFTEKAVTCTISIFPLPLNFKFSVFTAPLQMVIFPEPLMLASTAVAVSLCKLTLPEPLMERAMFPVFIESATTIFPEPLMR